MQIHTNIIGLRHIYRKKRGVVRTKRTQKQEEESGTIVRHEMHVVHINSNGEKKISKPDERTQLVLEVAPEVIHRLVKCATENGITVEEAAAIQMSFATGVFVLSEELFDMVSRIVCSAMIEKGIPFR